MVSAKKSVIATAAPQVVSQITFNMINLSSQFHQDVPTCDCFIENNLPPLKDRPSVVGGIPISTGPLVGGTRPTKLPTSKLNQLRSRYKQKHGNTWGVSHRLKTFSSYRFFTEQHISLVTNLWKQGGFGFVSMMSQHYCLNFPVASSNSTSKTLPNWFDEMCFLITSLLNPFLPFYTRLSLLLATSKGNQCCGSHQQRWDEEWDDTSLRLCSGNDWNSMNLNRFVSWS